METPSGTHIVGAALLSHAILETGCEDGDSLGRPVTWDSNLVELTHIVQSSVPLAVRDSWLRAQQRAKCGLVTDLRHAWVSVDSVLYLWDYSQLQPTVHTIPADSAIISVKICVPRQGIFDETDVCLVLVVATRLTVSFTGLGVSSDCTARGAAPSGEEQPSRAADHVAVSDRSAPANKWSGLRLIPLEGYEAPTDGALFHCIQHTLDGRIFLACGAPWVYELVYSSTPSWFCSTCRLVRHSTCRWYWTADFSSGPGRIRLLECTKHGHVFTVDDVNTLRLYRVQDGTHKKSASASTLVELTVMHVAELSQQVLALTSVHLISYTVTHLFPIESTHGPLRVVALTSAGERLNFTCSIVSGSIWRTQQQSQPRPRDDSTMQHSYGFWLRSVSKASSGSNGAGGAKPAQVRSQCLEQSCGPCVYANGSLLVTNQHAKASTIGICAHVGAHVGCSSALELHTSLTFDAPVLDLAEERAGLDCNADVGIQSFVVLFPTCIQVVRLSCKARTHTRPPATAEECFLYLKQIVQGSASAVSGSVPIWMWSIDDAQVPSFQEQQRYMLQERTMPPMNIGKWFCGLLQFLATMLRPVWGATLVVKMQDMPVLGVCKRRRSGTLRFALQKDLVQHVLGQLRPVLQFAKEGMLRDVPDTEMLSNAAERSRLYSQERVEQEGALLQVEQFIHSVVGIIDRVQQVFGLIAIVQQQRLEQVVLQSSVFIASSGPDGLLMKPLSELVQTHAALSPVVQLCNALVVESTTMAAMDLNATDISEQIRAACPEILSQVDACCVPLLVGKGWPAAGSRAGNFNGSRAGYGTMSSCEGAGLMQMQSVKTLTPEKARSVAKICIQKLQSLHRSDAATVIIARKSLEMLLAALDPKHLLENCQLIMNILTQPVLLDFVDDATTADSEVPFLHTVILDYLLKSPQLHNVFEALLTASIPDMAAYLRSRYSFSPIAGDFLWKYYLKCGQASRASGVLLQLAERTDSECNLQARLDYLRLAKDCACNLPLQSELQSEEACKILTTRLRVASLVQLPLHHELCQIASDPRVSSRWRGAAAEHSVRLQLLLNLQELYSTARDFALFHIVLLIVAVSGSEPKPEVVSSLWVSLFFPPEASPYSPPEMSVEGLCGATVRSLFPILMLRQNALFFSHDLPTPQSEGPLDIWGGELCPDLLRLRAMALVGELQHTAKSPSAIWEIRCIITIFEYCNCVWVHALETGRSVVNCIGGTGVSDQVYSWVACQVLIQEPFEFTFADIVTFYAEMLAHLNAWLPDLKAMLPEEAVRPSLGEETVCLHLSRVVLTVLRRWVEMMENGQADEATVVALRAAWPRTAQNVLASLSLRLNGLQNRHPLASRLLPELLRLETAGRLACGHGMSMPVPQRDVLMNLKRPERSSFHAAFEEVDAITPS